MSLETKKPICVDLDGTLIRNDISLWSFNAFVKKSFFNWFRAIFWFIVNMARMKKIIAQEIELDTGILEYNKEFVDFLIKKREEGISIFLATASDEIYANKVADDLGIFDGVFASNGEVRLVAETKAKALCTIFGEGGFIYAGNSKDDLKVWEKSGGAILVSPTSEALEGMRGKHYFLFK